MLFFESVKDRGNFPVEIVEIMMALEKRGFQNHVAPDLELINLGRKPPLVEEAGKITWNGLVVGYVRGVKP